MRPNWQRVYGPLIVISLLCAVGLLAALLVEPVGRYVSWFAVGLPVIVVLWPLFRSRITK